MPETIKDAPKSAEHKVASAEVKPHFENASDYFHDQQARQEQLAADVASLEAKDVSSMDSAEVLAHGRDLQAANDALAAHAAEYKAFGGDRLDQARDKLAETPDNAQLRKSVERSEAIVHENYLNKYNEYAQLSPKDRGEFVKEISEDLPKADDPQFFEKIARLEQDLIADGGITRSQAGFTIKEAIASRERQSKPVANTAPEGLPTTKEAQDATNELEKNDKKVGLLRRAWDGLNFRVGYGMFAAGDFLARRKEKDAQKSKRLAGETDEQYGDRLKRLGRRTTLATAAIGATYIGVRFLASKVGAENTLDSTPMIDGETGLGEIGQGSLGSFAEGLPVDGAESAQLPALPDDKEIIAAGIPGAQESAESADAADRIAESAERGGLDTFEGTMFDGYNPAEDAFNMPGKTGEVNWGAPIPTELAADAHFGVAGLDELVGQSWATSPEQMAAVASELGLEGFDTATLEDMAEQMKANPNYAHDVYTDMLDVLNDPNTRISEGEPLVPGTYGSYYETMVDGNGVISYDHVVNEPGSTIKIEYTDKNGVARVIELKRECGGQVIHRHPVEESLPTGGATYNPVTYTENIPPQGGATPEVPYTPPVVENPPVVDVPPTGGETPPTVETPPTGGETPPSVPVLEPKILSEDINANPFLPEQLQMGDQAGTIQPGELDLNQVESPAEYTPEPAPQTSTEVAAGAEPNTRTDTGGESQPEIPAPETGASGEAASDVVTGRVDG